jgi:hypothetical protein
MKVASLGINLSDLPGTKIVTSTLKLWVMVIGTGKKCCAFIFTTLTYKNIVVEKVKIVIIKIFISVYSETLLTIQGS